MRIVAKEISIKQNDDGTFDVVAKNDGHIIEFPRSKINLEIEAYAKDSENNELFRFSVDN